MTRFGAPARSRELRRVVGNRLPRASTVVDVAWRPGSPLELFDDDYSTVAVTRDGNRQHGPTVRADPHALPLAGARVECALVLEPVGGRADRRAVLLETMRILVPGGLVVVSASSRPRPDGARRTGLDGRRTAAAWATALSETGLVPEQVHHLRFPLHPLSVASRVRARARSGRSRTPTGVGLTDPWLCRAAATLDALHPARRPRASVLVLARKP